MVLRARNSRCALRNFAAFSRTLQVHSLRVGTLLLVEGLLLCFSHVSLVRNSPCTVEFWLLLPAASSKQNSSATPESPSCDAPGVRAFLLLCKLPIGTQCAVSTQERQSAKGNTIQHKMKLRTTDRNQGCELHLIPHLDISTAQVVLKSQLIVSAFNVQTMLFGLLAGGHCLLLGNHELLQIDIIG